MQSPASSLRECWAYFTKMVYDIPYLHIIEHFHVFLRTTGLLWCAAPRFFPNFAGGYPPPRPQRVHHPSGFADAPLGAMLCARWLMAPSSRARPPSNPPVACAPRPPPRVPSFPRGSPSGISSPPCNPPRSPPLRALALSPALCAATPSSRPPASRSVSRLPPTVPPVPRLPPTVPPVSRPPLPLRQPHIRKQHTPHHCVVCFSYGASARSMAFRLASDTRLPCSQS